MKAMQRQDGVSRRKGHTWLPRLAAAPISSDKPGQGRWIVGIRFAFTSDMMTGTAPGTLIGSNADAIVPTGVVNLQV